MALSLDNSLKDNGNKNLKLFSNCLREMELMYGPNFHRFSRTRQQSRLDLDYQHAGFFKFKPNIRIGPYLYLIRKRKYRFQQTKLRVSDHKLPIETGKTP